MKFDYCKDEMILKVYPTVSACFESAFSLFKKHFWMLILIIFVGGAIDSPMWFMQNVKEVSDGGYQFTFHLAELLQTIYYFAVSSIFSFGIVHIFIRVVRKQDFVFEEIFDGFKTYSRVFLSNLLITLIVIAGLILLLVPGIFLICRLVFVPYLIMDKKHDVMESIKISFYMSKGYFWTVFGMGILSFVIIVFGLVLLGFGILISLVWINAAFAVLYNACEDLHYEEACKTVGVIPEEK